ncbi:hypothetical protein [Polyangium sp. y55x31]|uniref:hypothetical protein n=1 Tax=Polyangium sp. y55x31 TaxID=3042688 RepID=UPI002482EFBF|nr:hypothetical protein [Polyangium sp. y55x31]MDI1476950.1 hypothetical protein [Polyangium sp. y55x31]
MRVRLLLALATIPLVTACTGGSSSEPVKTPEAGTGKDTTTDAPAGARVAANSPLAGKDERFGTVRAFAGDDPGKTVAIPGKRAWTVGPGESWTISLYEFVRADGTKNVFKGPAGEPDFAIPGAYTFPATPARGLAKGALVLVPVEGSTTCGRVLAASEAEIKVAFLFDTKRTEQAFQPDQVLPLDGKLAFAAPVAYKQQPDSKGWTLGTLVYTDGTTAWLQGATRVPAAQVKPLDVVRAYKAGDKVFAVPAESDAFVAATVTKVEGDGLQYEIKTPDGATKLADVCAVTPPF